MFQSSWVRISKSSLLTWWLSLNFISSLFWGIVQPHTRDFPPLRCHCGSFPAISPLWAHRKHTSAGAKQGIEVVVRCELVINWQRLLPAQLCLTGTTTLVNELFIKDQRWTHRCVSFPWYELNLDNAFVEGRNMGSYHDREKNILTGKTFSLPHRHHLSPAAGF